MLIELSKNFLEILKKIIKNKKNSNRVIIFSV